jgi:hypothetical protein
VSIHGPLANVYTLNKQKRSFENFNIDIIRNTYFVNNSGYISDSESESNLHNEEDEAHEESHDRIKEDVIAVIILVRVIRKTTK